MLEALDAGRAGYNSWGAVGLFNRDRHRGSALGSSTVRKWGLGLLIGQKGQLYQSVYPSLQIIGTQSIQLETEKLTKLPIETLGNLAEVDVESEPSRTDRRRASPPKKCQRLGQDDNAETVPRAKAALGPT